MIAADLGAARAILNRIIAIGGTTAYEDPVDADYFARVYFDGNPDRIVLARCGGHNHPVFGYWPLSCADALETFLKTGTTRKVLAFVDDHANARAEFEGSDHDPFFNINTPDDLARASALAREGVS